MIVPFQFDQSQPAPIYRQLYQRLRESIADGRLRPGDRIPAVRALAAELNLARGTVEAAYQLLIGEGYLIARGAAGTFVTPQLAPVPSTTLRAPVASPTYQATHSGTLPLALQMGLLALDAFPSKLWTRLAGRQLRQAGLEGLVYPDSRAMHPCARPSRPIWGFRGVSPATRIRFLCALAITAAPVGFAGLGQLPG